MASMLARLAPLSLAGFAAALLLLEWLDWPPAAAEHLALAIGALPLILAAMIHFTPVLTRGRPAPPALTWVPALGLLGAGWVFAALLWMPSFFHGGALAALAAVTWLGAWMWHRGRTGLSLPHPCLSWYLAALLCLGAGLLAILLTAVWPAQWLALKRFHLHLNTLGFVGLTALGTLQVLLPTAGAYADPEAARRLHAGLPYALTGTVLVAFGAGWWPPLAWLGGLLWLWPLTGFLVPVLWRFRASALAPGAPRLLVAAGIGLAVNLSLGLLHGSLHTDTSAAIGLYLLWFLLPLVVGASAHLLPVWWGYAGPQIAAARALLGQGSGLRVLLLAAAGFIWIWDGAWGLYLGVAVLVQHLALVLRAARRRDPV